MNQCLARRALKSVFSALIAVILSGCAIAPDLGGPRAPRADLAFNQSCSSVATQNWWTIYKDPQLDALINEGLAASPTIEQAAASIQKADAYAMQAGAAALPSVTADVSFQKYKQSYNMGVPASVVPHGFQDLSKAGLTFAYDFDFWGRNKEMLNAVLSEREAAQLEAEHTKIIISTSIAAAYVQLAQLYSELDEAKESVNVRFKTVNLFEKRHKNGLENEGGVKQAIANHASAEAEVAAIEELVNLTCNQLAALVGATPERSRSIKRPVLSNVRPFGDVSSLPADLIARRPDIGGSKLKLEAAAARINVARTGFYPNINFAATIGQQSLSLDKFTRSGSFASTIGPAIHLPVFMSKYLEGAYQDAYADYNAAVAAYESTIIQALHEVADALTSQKALAIRLDKTKTAMHAAEQAYSVINNRYKGGLATYLEVLRAEDILILARRATTNIESRVFTLDVALVKSMGGGFQSAQKTKECAK